jgi:hypothetical protein
MYAICTLLSTHTWQLVYMPDYPPAVLLVLIMSCAQVSHVVVTALDTLFLQT